MRMDEVNNRKYCAVLSGAFASAASLFGKLTGLPLFEDLLIIRIVCFALMILCNGCVWTFYVRALQATSSSLSATVTSAATNYLLSGIYGLVIFDEVTGLIWWSGAGLILLGLILIVNSQENERQDEEITNEKNKVL